MTVVGEIVERERSVGKLSFEWRIPDFFRWGKIDDLYDRLIPSYPQSGLVSHWCFSPSFIFCNDIWTLHLDTDIYSYDSAQVELCFFREEGGSDKSIRYTFGIKDVGGREVRSVYYEQDFPGYSDGGGVLSWPDFWSMSYLRRNRYRLVPGNVFTIMGVFESKEPRVSLSCGFRDPLQLVPKEGRGTPDFTLKVGERKWPVHKHVLASRSEYFASMFRGFPQEWSENPEGGVRFSDLKEDVLDCMLKFIYDRNVKDVPLKSVCDIYVAADRFLLPDLKASCVEVMKHNLGPDSVWGALAIAKMYGEKKLKGEALMYLSCEKVRHVCVQGWKRFMQNYPSIAAEVLEEINGDFEDESEEE